MKYEIPEEKKKLITEGFLKTLKEELDIEFALDLECKYNTYHGTYSQLTCTGGYDKAFKRTCQRQRKVKSLYNYVKDLPWYASDQFEDRLLLMMVEENLLELGVWEEHWAFQNIC